MRSELIPILFGGLDRDALDWASRVSAVGGSVSNSTRKAVSAFAKQCKTAGIWDKIIRVNLFCGDSLTACLVPLKVGGGNATDTNVNYVAGDYTEATGLTGNGSSKYLRTGLIPSASLTLNSLHAALYNRSGLGSRGDMSAGPSDFYMNATFTDGKIYAVFGSSIVSAVLTPPYGLLLMTRTAANALAIYQNGVSVGSNASAGGALASTEYYVSAFNAGGTPSSFSTAALAGYSMGAGLTAGEVSIYNTIMEQFQDSLGRGVQ